MKFVASADWQLGMTAHFLPDEARARYHEARLDAVRRIGEIAADHEAAFVVVAGDVFESNHLDRRVVARALDAMRSVDVPIWLLPGNHDPLDAASLYSSSDFRRLRPDHVHVLDTPGVHTVADGVDLVAAPWFSKRPLSDLVSDAVASIDPDPARRRIVVGHGAVWSADSADPSAIDTDGLDRAARDGRIDVTILGDRHSLTRVGDRVWYPGTPEVTDRREVDPGYVLVFDTDDLTAPTPVRAGRWVFEVVEEQLDGSQDVGDLIARLAAAPDRRRRSTWLKLTGTLGLAAKARLDSALDEQADLYALLEHWDRHTDLAVLPADGEIGDLGLTGFARDAVEELTELAEQDTAARDALSLLYRLAGGGR